MHAECLRSMRSTKVYVVKLNLILLKALGPSITIEIHTLFGMRQ